MATNPHYGLAAREAALDNALNLANSGTLVIYDGTQPASSDTAVTTQNVLATFTLGATAWGAATGSAGASVTKTLNSVSNVNASRTGTASWFRIYKSDATTGVADGSVGTASADLILNSTSLVNGAQVSLTSAVVTFAA